MKTIKLILISILLSGFVLVGHAQNQFGSCSAAFLNNKLVVDDYSPKGRCVLSQDTKGFLNVAEAIYEDSKWHQTTPIEFMVAIRDKNTQTLMMYSTEVYQKIELQKVMIQCQKGDHIVLLTLKNKYSLPHNEILVQ